MKGLTPHEYKLMQEIREGYRDQIVTPEEEFFIWQMFRDKRVVFLALDLHAPLGRKFARVILTEQGTRMLAIYEKLTMGNLI